jgi:eukaryotic-like serine/threonine-protein kinase
MVTNPTTTCLNCGCLPIPGSPLGLCSKCLSERLLDPGREGEPDAEELTAAFAKYDLAGEMARGGMGSILRAKDRTLGRTVAMKVMLLKADAGEESRRRFTREALVLARLDHPNIVPIHEMGRDDQDRPFYTMKLVEGETLQAILRRLASGDPTTIREYTLDRLLNIFRKVCEGMAFAHDRGVIHRDLKPDNIMVGRFGEVLVMDWGLAKFVVAEAAATTPPELTDHSTRVIRKGEPKHIRGWSDPEFRLVSTDVTMDGEIVGTPTFMSPEQARGIELDQRSDIFSLGAILYAILTLRPPVEGKDLEEILLNVAQANITPPTRLASVVGRPHQEGGPACAQGTFATPAVRFPHCPNGRVPWALSAVAMQALARQPADRYPGAEALAKDVEAYQGGFATAAERAGAFAQLWLWMKRHKTVSISAGLIALLSVVFLLKVMASERKATSNAERASHEAAQARLSAEMARQSEQTAVARQEETRRALAVSQMNLAANALGDANPQLARQQLAGVPADLRDASWAYLNREADSSVAQFPMESSLVIYTGVAPVPGRPGVIAAVSRTGRVVLLDGADGKVQGAWESGLTGGTCLSISPDGRWLAVGADRSAEVAVLDLGQRKEWRRIRTQDAGTAQVALAPGGRLLRSSSSRPRAEWWDLDTGRQLDAFTPARGSKMWMHPDGKRVSTQGALLNVQDAAGNPVKEWETDANVPVTAAALAADGKSLVTGDAQGYVTRWNVGAGRSERVARISNGRIMSLAITPGGGHLLALCVPTPGDYTEPRRVVLVVDAQTMTVLRTLMGAMPDASNLCLDDSGRFVAVDGRPGKIWLLPFAREYAQWARLPIGMEVAFLGSDEHLLTPFANLPVTLLHLGREPLPEALWRPAFTPRPHLAVSTDGHTFMTYSAASGGQLTVHRREDDAIRTVSLATNRLPVFSAALDEHGRRLALVQNGRPEEVTVQAVAGDAPPVQLIFPGLRRLFQAEFIPGSDRVVANGIVGDLRAKPGSQEVLVTWDLGSPNAGLAVTNSFAVYRLAASPDGTRLAAACSDGFLRLLHPQTLETLQAFRAHEAGLATLAWHPAGNHLVTASEDLSVKVWDLRRWELIQVIVGPTGPCHSLSFSPGGRLLAGAFHDNTVRVWELDRPAPHAGRSGR